MFSNSRLDWLWTLICLLYWWAYFLKLLTCQCWLNLFNPCLTFLDEALISKMKLVVYHFTILHFGNWWVTAIIRKTANYVFIDLNVFLNRWLFDCCFRLSFLFLPRTILFCTKTFIELRLNCGEIIFLYFFDEETLVFLCKYTCEIVCLDCWWLYKLMAFRLCFNCIYIVRASKTVFKL